MILRTLVRRFAILSAAFGSCAALAAPLAAVTFSPNPVAQGQPVRLAVTVSDTASGTLTNLSLPANQVVFPSGMVILANPPVDNQCGGTVVANVGDSTLSISGANPAGGFCAVYLYLGTPSSGTFTVTMPANAVTSDQGTNSAPWSDTLTVNPTQLVTTNADAGVGSLRQAILNVNANCSAAAGGLQRIEFNVDVAGPVLIEPLTALPQITCGNVTIDGYTEPLTSPNGSPMGCTMPSVRIELSGAKCGPGCNGLEMGSYQQVVTGLALHSWNGSSIRGVGGGSVIGNIIGGDTTGTPPSPNDNGWGISLANGSLAIGSGLDSDRNLIVGNTVGIQVDTGANVTVSNNQLGGQGCGSGGGNGIGIFFAKSSNGGNVDNNFIRYGSGAGIAQDPLGFRPRIGTSSPNSIADNGGIGIDLNNDGPTPNDAGEVDGIQNFAVVTGITFDGTNTTVSTHLQTTPNTSVGVRLYQNSRAIAGMTEGETHVETLSGFTDASGALDQAFIVVGNADNFSTQVIVCGDGCSASSEFSPTYTQAMFAPPVGPLLDLSANTNLQGFVNYSRIDDPVTLLNSGDQDLTLGTITFTPGGTDFTLGATTCGTTLKPGESCQQIVTFAPTTAGSQGITLAVSSNAALSPTYLDIGGTGLLPLQIAIVTPPNPAAGSTTTATLEVTNPNPVGTYTFGGVTGTLTVPAGFTIDATNTPSCPTYDPTALSAPLKLGTKAAVVTAGGYYVAAGQNCTLYDVQMTAPSTPGPYTFSVGVDAVLVNTPATWENPTAVNATVTVVPASLTVSPSSLAFGSVTTGASSPPQSVTLLSSSRTTVPVASITAPAGYVITTNCSAGVPPTGCTINVAFAPTTAGPDNGNLVIDAGGATYSVALSGTGTAPPRLLAATVSPSTLAFAPRSVGTRSPAVAVTVTNTGTSPLSILDIAISGDFGFDSACPVTTTLAPGASCDVNVTFAPLVTGLRGGTLTVTTNDPASPHTVALSGSGVILPTATLAIDPAAVDFGTLTLGTTSAVQLVTISNTGNADALLSTSTNAPFALAAPPAGRTACGSALVAGASCVVGLTFTPVVSGGVPGALVVTSNASNPRITVSLSGIGSAGPPPRALTVPSSLDFGGQAFGTRSAARTLTLTNTTALAITVTDIAVAGDFSADDGCAIVPARGTCSLNVYFTPTARGARAGQVSITVAGDTRPYVVFLAGDGGANPQPVLNATPARIGFGNALVGPAGPQKSITLTNAGELPVVLGGIVSPGDFLVTSHCPTTIPVGGSCTLDVVFYPRLTGLRSQTLQVPYNASNSPARVDLSGTGCSLPNVARARIGQLVCSQ